MLLLGVAMRKAVSERCCLGIARRDSRCWRVLPVLLVSVVLAGTLAGRAAAIPILAIDLDAGTTAIEDFREIALGEQIEIAVWIRAVDATEPLNGFELDLGFDGNVITILSAIDGAVLVPPVQNFQNLLDPPAVEFASVTVGSAAASGEGLLVLLSLRGDVAGTTLLSLGDVILSAPFGVPIAVGGLEDASLVVVPEPGTGVLLSLGLLGLGAVRSGRSGCGRDLDSRLLAKT